MKKNVIVSNRLPVSIAHSESGFSFKESIGGLATGLSSIHKNSDSVWIGWPGIESESITAKQKEQLETTLYEEYKCIPVWLTQNELDKYYYGFCNNTIWPLFHYFANNAVYDEVLWAEYQNVNRKFFERSKPYIHDDSLVWVHDYQLLLLPELLKAENDEASVGFFLHIPFPSFELFRLIPWRDEILEGLLGADLIGFHTYDYARHFLSSVRRLLGHEHQLGSLSVHERPIKIDVFPMGIDYKKYNTASRLPEVQKEIQKLEKNLKTKNVILSVDRLDYTKGILQRIKAYQSFLLRYPEYRENVQMILIVAPSRIAVSSYLDLKKEIEEMVGNINGELGTMGWIPIWFFFQSFSFEELSALYRKSNILLVCPVRDGMNLVAKEYVAAHEDSLGTVVLSETAGAAREMSEAIIVNANNDHEMSDAIHEALLKPESEQASSNVRMQKRLMRYTVQAWAKDFMTSLEEIHSMKKDMPARMISSQIKNELCCAFEVSRNPVLFLDYDGTLVTHNNRPDKAKPDAELIQLLKELGTMARVVIISRRDRKNMEQWLGHLDISIVASHGIWTKVIDGEWILTEQITNEWKDQIRPILERFTDRTPGSHIDEKEYSIAWQYRHTEPDLASIRVSELRETLMDITNNQNIGLVEGRKEIEVKDITINKGRAISKYLMGDTHDFILALGDDWTDEEMFQVMPEHAYDIRVGSGITHAKYSIKNSKQARKLLKDIVKHLHE